MVDVSPTPSRSALAKGGREQTLMAVRKIRNHGKWVWQARVAKCAQRRLAVSG